MGWQGGGNCCCDKCACNNVANACCGLCDSPCDCTNPKSLIVDVVGLVPPAIIPCPPVSTDCCLGTPCRGSPAYNFSGTFSCSPNFGGNPCSWAYVVPASAQGLGFFWWVTGSNGAFGPIISVGFWICGVNSFLATNIAAWSMLVPCKTGELTRWKSNALPATLPLTKNPPPCPAGCSDPLICPGGFLSQWTVPPTVNVRCS